MSRPTKQNAVDHTARATVGAYMTAREMALRSHNLDRSGNTSTDHEGAVWKWSDHFNVWACVSAPRACSDADVGNNY
jgi:hypothetical protein